jgi:hypothetical protein
MATFLRETGEKERHKRTHLRSLRFPAAEGQRSWTSAARSPLDLARQNSSLEQVLLAVATTQEAARRLYRSFGFETYGTERRALKIGSTYIDEDHMILRVGQDVRYR